MFSNLSAKSIAVIEMQALLFAVLVAATARFWLDFGIFLAVIAVVGATYWYVLLKPVRKVAGSEFRHYAVFFGGLWAILQALWLAQVLLPPAQHYSAFVGIIIGIVAFVLCFRLLLGRGYTYGKVLACNAGSKTAVVETEFDILSFTNAGKHAVECAKTCRVGENARVGLAFGLLGGKPKRIL